MGYQKLLCQTDAGITRITLNRPEKRNALDAEMIAELKDAIAKSKSLILLSGAAPDFCSGMDLAALDAAADAPPLDHVHKAGELAALFMLMRKHPRPIIAAVRGRALAGGCGLATAADIILASESAHFGYPEIKRGFVPAMVMALVRRSISEKRIFELIATGEAIDAAAALACGLVNHVYPDASFEPEVTAFASQLAAASAPALELAKRLLYRTDALPWEAALDTGIEFNALSRATADAKQGIAAFLKKS
jgi:methylglutaconyl-CoA hydratase